MRASLFALLLIGCAHRATGPLEVLPESARDLAKQLGRPTYGEPLQPLAQRSRVLHEPGLDGVAALVAHVWDDEQRDLADAVVEQLVWHAGVPGVPGDYRQAV